MREAGRIGLLPLLALLALSVPAPTADDPRVAAALEEARSAADELTATLKQMLQAELKESGFDGAVAVCANRAQETTQTLASKRVHIRRVSLKHRNPANVPDAFERRALALFEQLPAAARAQAEHFEVVSEDGREQLRYLRPLVTGPVCVVCHGKAERLPAAIRAVLAERYPDDRATGFAVGDVRGAVSVRVALPGPAAE